MRRFKNVFQNLNLGYVLGEVLLIFVGINLAIWFNNWNATKQLRRDKAIVLERIEEEIQSNLEELSTATQVNSLVAEGLQEYGRIFQGNTDWVVTTSQHMAELQSRFPGCFPVARLRSGG